PGCAGGMHACSSLLDSVTCGAASSICSWSRADGSCGGTPTQCDQLSIADCTKQRGCMLDSPSGGAGGGGPGGGPGGGGAGGGSGPVVVCGGTSCGAGQICVDNTVVPNVGSTTH